MPIKVLHEFCSKLLLSLFLIPPFQMKEIYHDYFSYLMDEKVTAKKMAREFWNELDDTRPLGASLQQEVPNWPWATKIVVLS